jgi:hypothetical protein
MDRGFPRVSSQLNSPIVVESAQAHPNDDPIGVSVTLQSVKRPFQFIIFLLSLLCSLSACEAVGERLVEPVGEQPVEPPTEQPREAPGEILLYLYDEPSQRILVNRGAIPQRGARINISSLPSEHWNLAAVGNGIDPKSMAFHLSGTSSRRESVAPFTAVREDGSGKNVLVPGRYSLDVRAYSQTNLKGSLLASAQWNFEIEDFSEEDVTPPDILSATMSGATLSVQTNELARIRAHFGEGHNRDQMLETQSAKLQSQLQLPGLRPGVVYSVEPEAIDLAGNTRRGEVIWFELPKRPKRVFPGAEWEKVAPEVVDVGFG